MRYVRKALVLGVLAAMSVGCSSLSDVTDGDPREMTTADARAELQEQREGAEERAQEERDRARVRASLEGVTRAPHRSSDNQERDEFRNPVDTLLFFGMDTDQTVVELNPGGGWYTEIIAPVLADDGVYVAGVPHVREGDETYQRELADQFHNRIEQLGDLLGDISIGTFSPGDTVDLGETGSADLVVTFRNLHSWYNTDQLDDALQEVHQVLKPGGVFGVVAHRAPEDSDRDVRQLARQGYLPESYVIERVEAAGFVLEESSDINANPNDTADHPDGVWSLPPSLRGGEDTEEQFLAIGESDRMTLRFVKADQDRSRGADREEADGGEADGGEDRSRGR